MITKEKGSLIEQKPSGIAQVAHFVTTSQVTDNLMHLLTASHPGYVVERKVCFVF